MASDRPLSKRKLSELMKSDESSEERDELKQKVSTKMGGATARGENLVVKNEDRLPLMDEPGPSMVKEENDNGWEQPSCSYSRMEREAIAKETSAKENADHEEKFQMVDSARVSPDSTRAIGDPPQLRPHRYFPRLVTRLHLLARVLEETGGYSSIAEFFNLVKIRYLLDACIANQPYSPCLIWPYRTVWSNVHNFFVLDAGYTIPLHAHPGCVGLIRVLSGCLTVRAFSPLSREEVIGVRQEHRVHHYAELYRRMTEIHLNAGSTWLFYETVGNAHEMEADYEQVVFVEIHLSATESRDPIITDPLENYYFLHVDPVELLCTSNDRPITSMHRCPPPYNFFHYDMQHESEIQKFHNL